MRGFSLGLQGFARTAAVFGGGAAPCLEPMRPLAQAVHRSRMSSNIPACSENRYPSLMARSAHPPRRPRHSFFVQARLSFAEKFTPRFSRFAHCKTGGNLSGIETLKRAGNSCVNPFFFSPFCRPPRLRAVCPPMANAPLQVPPQGRSLRMQPTTTRSLARPLARLRAPIATTRACAANPSRLNRAQPRTRHCNQLSGPRGPGGFFVNETIAPATGSRVRVADRADMI